MKISRGKATGVAVVCIALLMACTTGRKKDRDPAGANGESGNAIRDAISGKAIPDENKYRSAQYKGLNTTSTAELPDVMSAPPPPMAPPPPVSAFPGPTEDIIPLQIQRMKLGQTYFEKVRAKFPSNGGRINIGNPAERLRNPDLRFGEPTLGGFWQMPPLPSVQEGGRTVDSVVATAPNGRQLTLPMKMGAIQASVLPSGKVLMVSGSSNRGDARPMTQKNPPVTSQSYAIIDNTSLFDPSLVPGIPDDLSTDLRDLPPLEYPGVAKDKIMAAAKPLGVNTVLYERPFSLPPAQVGNPIHGLHSDIGTLRDPKFCAQERPKGTKMFNNGIPIPADPEAYCKKIADPALRGGVGVQLPLVENASPDPVDPNMDLFCGGHMPLPDGNVLFAGGTRKAISFTEDFTAIPFHGLKRTLVFDWRAQQWKDANPRGPLNMGDGRWYPTLVELPDGKVFIIGGMNHRGEISHTLEVYDPKTQTMSNLIDFRQLGGRPMANEPFTVFDPQAGRRFDNYPRVFLTHQAHPGCNDQLRCSRLMITGDGSAEGNRDIETRPQCLTPNPTVADCINHTLYVDVDTRQFPNIRVNFVKGPTRSLQAQGARKTHEYTSHFYPTQLFDPTTETGDYLIVGGSVGKYDPLHTAQDARDENGEKKVNPDASTFFNRKRDQRTVSDLERFDGARGTFEPVFENFLGDDGDVNSKVATSRAFPNAWWDTVPCDDHQPKTGANVCGPLNSSGFINPNAVLLPTRQFLVMGGGNHSYTDPVFNPLLFTPANDPIVRPPAAGKFVGWGNKWIRNYMNPFHLPRLYHNTALLLPDGRVFMGSGNTFISFMKGTDAQGLPIVGAAGGQANNYNNFDGADKISGLFKSIADPSTPGGIINLSFLSVDLPAEQYQVELFNPPYMFIPGPRPVIQGIQTQGQSEMHRLPDKKRWIDPDREDILGYGAPLNLALKNVADGSRGRVTMIRLGGVTHAINFSQKLQTLHSVVGGSVNMNDGGIVTVRSPRPGENPIASVATPGSPRAAPPGYYMLFFVNDKGKPSESRVVRLCNLVRSGGAAACAEDPA